MAARAPAFIFQKTTISFSPTRILRLILSPIFSSGRVLRLAYPFMTGIGIRVCLLLF
jgi:hypothetical protein